MEPSRSTDASGHFNDVPNRRPKRNLIHSGTTHVPRNTKQTIPGRICRADAGIRRAATQNNFRHIDQRLDVVHNGRLAEQSALRRKRRLVARFAAVAFDGIEQRGLLAANVRTGSAPDFNVERKPVAQNIVTKKVLRPCGVNGVL